MKHFNLTSAGVLQTYDGEPVVTVVKYNKTVSVNISVPVVINTTAPPPTPSFNFFGTPSPPPPTVMVNKTVNQTVTLNTTTILYAEALKIPLLQYINRISKSFYNYVGSLTTPNCTEGVNWVIMQEIQYMSFADIAQFNRFWGGNKNFSNGNGNNRMVQPLNGRPVYFK